MRIKPCQVLPFLAAVLALATARPSTATERYFTQTYEPETLPAGATEFEQWVTFRATRNDAVDQRDYFRGELREELEHGWTDWYSTSLYLNSRSTTFERPSTGEEFSRVQWDGIAVENRWMVLNPAEHPVGLGLYLEPRWSEREGEVEEKIILGQRHGAWKWAFNLGHATEWNFRNGDTEGEAEVTFGVTRAFSKRWSAGLELRDHAVIPEYERWENNALFVGPVVTCTLGDWWATLSVMPQVRGWNFGEDPDGNSSLDLADHERLNLRLIVGVSF